MAELIVESVEDYSLRHRYLLDDVMCYPLEIQVRLILVSACHPNLIEISCSPYEKWETPRLVNLPMG